MSKERETEEEEAKRGRVIAVAALLLLITLSFSVLLASGIEPEIEMGGVDAWVSDGIDVEVNETRGRVEDVTIGDPVELTVREPTATEQEVALDYETDWPVHVFEPR